MTRLFNTRLDILVATIHRRDNPAFAQAIADCRAMLQRVPTGSFLIRKVWGEVAGAWTDDFWSYLTPDRLNFLRLKVAPLLRFVPDVDVAAETFTNKVERLALAGLSGQPTPDDLTSIANDVARLTQETRERAANKPAVDLALSTELAQASRAQLTDMIQKLAPEMKNKRRADTSFLTVDIPDFLAVGQEIIISATGSPVHVEEYRKRVDQRILDITDGHAALIALRTGQEPTREALIDLERVLNNALGTPEIAFNDKVARQVYGLKWGNRIGFLGLVRHVLSLDALPDYAAVVAHAFEDHITSHRYTGDQIRFLRAVQDVFLDNGYLTEADLYDAPTLSAFGRNAVERFFGPAGARSLVRMTEELAA